MFNKYILSFGAIALLFQAHAYAGECTLSVTRDACPGQDSESLSKCDGKKSCDESKKTGSAEACAKEAIKACQNKRTNVTKSKIVIAKFGGQPVEGGKDFCKTKVDGLYDPEKDYPFRDKADCK
ncbi:hypothetical protein WDW37_18340 [Bdellovibrionota bacterium FG-1]